MTGKKLSILVAAYNEEATLRACLEAVLAAPACGLAREIILVNDASTDETALIADALARQYPEVRVFHQEKNQGKGAALRRAIKEATGHIAIFQDADLEYDPRDYARLIQPILDGKADVVFGSRFTGEVRKVLYFWHTAGNRFLTLLSNIANNINVTDMETCYKVFRLDLLKTIPLESNRFGIEPEITAKVARNRWRIFEVPINYNGRTYEEGKKIGWRDGVAAFWFILRYSFSQNYSEPGRATLDALEHAPRLNQWMYETIKPYLGARIAELGSGTGNLTRWLKTTDGATVLATDYSVSNFDRLKGKFGGLSRVRIEKLDLTLPDDYGVLNDFKPDTIVCLNVLEHIEKDRDVLARLHETLPDDCRIIFLVPRSQKLWSNLDVQLGHFRRYETGELSAKMQDAGFTVEREFTFNRAGTPSWFIGNKLGGQRTLKPWQGKLYNFLCPAFQALEGVFPWKGLSVICVAKKITDKNRPARQAAAKVMVK
jgi:glycosyltransferase involved in cell wall biosynthesis